MSRLEFTLADKIERKIIVTKKDSSKQRGHDPIMWYDVIPDTYPHKSVQETIVDILESTYVGRRTIDENLLREAQSTLEVILRHMVEHGNGNVERYGGVLVGAEVARSDRFFVEYIIYVRDLEHLPIRVRSDIRVIR